MSNSPKRSDSSVVVSIVDGKPVTTSLDIAAHFNKRHGDVLRAVRKLDCSPEFNERNFALIRIDTDLGAGRARKDPAFQMTRDGFVFLVMGFTGADAAKWKEAYINAFNQMEAALHEADPKTTSVDIPSLLGRRWLVSYDSDGRELVSQIPMSGMVVNTTDQYSINALIGEMPAELLAETMRTCLARLDYIANKALKKPH